MDSLMNQYNAFCLLYALQHMQFREMSRQFEFQID